MYSSINYTPSVCPVSVDFLRKAARIDQTYDDDLIASLAITATELVEDYMSRYLITRDITWTVAHTEHYGIDGQSKLYLMPWPWTTFVALPVVPLPRPATTINSVVIGIWNETAITLVENTDYEIDTTAKLGRIRWISNAFENTLKNYVQVDFTSGFSANQPLPTSQTDLQTAYIPQRIIQAICLITTKLYESRGEDDFGIWHPGVESLLYNFRYNYFG
jgi:hypothetical protein